MSKLKEVDTDSSIVCNFSSSNLRAQEFIFTSQTWKLIFCLCLHRIFVITVSISSLILFKGSKIYPFSVDSFESDIDRYGLGQRLHTHLYTH